MTEDHHAEWKTSSGTIERVLAACSEAGTSAPRICVESGDFWCETPSLEAYVAAISEGTGEDFGGISLETSQDRFLTLLRPEPTLTRTALAKRIGTTPNGIKYHFGKLREAGRIRHVGPTKEGHWEILGHGN